MFADYSQTYPLQTRDAQPLLSPFFVAIPVGFVLGLFFAWLLPIFSGMVFLAPWLLGLGIGFVATSLIWSRRYSETLWGMAILGQVCGIVALGLFLIGMIAS